MSKFNFGGLALSIVAGAFGATAAVAQSGVTSGHALSGAALAGAATGVVGFFIPTSSGMTGPQQIAHAAQVVATLAQVIPVQAQGAAQRILTQVAGGLEAAPAGQTPGGPPPSTDQWAVLLAQLKAELAQPTTGQTNAQQAAAAAAVAAVSATPGNAPAGS